MSQKLVHNVNCHLQCILTFTHFPKSKYQPEGLQRKENSEHIEISVFTSLHIYKIDIHCIYKL